MIKYGTRLNGVRRMNKPLKNIRKKIVVLKFTLMRGYSWGQAPTMAIIAAGVLKPFLPSFQFWQLSLIGLVIFITIGFIDRKLGFLSAEQSYITSQNDLLMQGLKGELKNEVPEVQRKSTT